MPSKKPLMIGIAGGTGSGKSTFAKLLQKQFRGQVVVISMDMYYKDQSDLPLEERLQANMDKPEALDLDLLCKQLFSLREGKSIERPIYNFIDHTRSKETIHVKPHPVVIVEGIFAFVNERLRELLDLEVYLEVDNDLRLVRRISRDVEEGRNGSLEGALNQYLTSARPMHKIYVEPQREWADIIVLWNDKKPDAVEVIAARIKERLAFHE